jgi:hypothetical protein
MLPALQPRHKLIIQPVCLSGPWQCHPPVYLASPGTSSPNGLGHAQAQADTTSSVPDCWGQCTRQICAYATPGTSRWSDQRRCLTGSAQANRTAQANQVPSRGIDSLSYVRDRALNRGPAYGIISAPKGLIIISCLHSQSRRQQLALPLRQVDPGYASSLAAQAQTDPTAGAPKWTLATPHHCLPGQPRHEQFMLPMCLTEA